jgi:hypothetical protein
MATNGEKGSSQKTVTLINARPFATMLGRTKSVPVSMTIISPVRREVTVHPPRKVLPMHIVVV